MLQREDRRLAGTEFWIDGRAQAWNYPQSDPKTQAALEGNNKCIHVIDYDEYKKVVKKLNDLKNNIIVALSMNHGEDYIRSLVNSTKV